GIQQIAPYRTFFYGSGAGRFAYARVSANFFDVLGVPVWRGRLPAPEDPSGAAITHAFWRARFHSDPGAIGASFRVGARIYTVTGILSPGFGFHQSAFFAPLGLIPAPEALALLKPGVSRERAEAELLEIARQVNPRRGSETIRLQPLVSRVAISLMLAVAL